MQNFFTFFYIPRIYVSFPFQSKNKYFNSLQIQIKNVIIDIDEIFE